MEITTEFIDRMEDPSLAPTELIDLMFERTDENGVLYIPEWPDFYGYSDQSYKCRVTWNLRQYEALSEEFDRLYYALEDIAPFWEALREKPLEAQQILGNSELFDVWCTYVRPLSTGDFDRDKIRDIEDRYETMEMVQDVAARLAQGEALTESERHVLTDYLDITVSPEEEEYHDRYVDALYADARSRLPRPNHAYTVILRAQRLFRLLNLKAPELLINNEARLLASALVLNRYGESKETVGNATRLHIARISQMTDEELDTQDNPLKSNNRKSIVPLFVYEILKNHSNTREHLRQNDILALLAEYPYEVTIERKALSRILHNLTSEQRYDIRADKTGWWMEQE